MNELLLAFTLGNAAILSNACLLPLYPGLLAFLAGNANNERARSASAWLGLLVLAGILTTMVGIGSLLALLRLQFGQVFPILLPLLYAVVIILGVLLLGGYNLFTRLQSAQAPLLRSPYLSAYSYGLFFGPMTLPCTGPIILSAVLVGAGAGDFVGDLLFFLFFGLGFGWPLVILPLIALPFQHRLVGWLSRNHGALNRASGVLLVAIGLFGILTELLPQLYRPFALSLPQRIVYWALVLLIAFGLAYTRRSRPKHKIEA